MIYRVAPVHGTSNPLVYLSICSLAGSVSIMAIKGLGVALKLTFSGNNQLTHLPTYIFALVVGGCIATQMNYFNKALDTFSTNVCVLPTSVRAHSLGLLHADAERESRLPQSGLQTFRS